MSGSVEVVQVTVFACPYDCGYNTESQIGIHDHMKHCSARPRAPMRLNEPPGKKVQAYCTGCGNYVKVVVTKEDGNNMH